jgi:hypothetical protein
MPVRDPTRAQLLDAQIATMQGRASDYLYGVPKGGMAKETFKALEDRFGDHHLADAYCSQLKTSTNCVEKFLQVLATVVEELVYLA